MHICVCTAGLCHLSFDTHLSVELICCKARLMPTRQNRCFTSELLLDSALLIIHSSRLSVHRADSSGIKSTYHMNVWLVPRWVAWSNAGTTRHVHECRLDHQVDVEWRGRFPS